MADIITLAGNFKNTKDLISYTNASFTALKNSMERIKQLEDEVKHLQELLTSTTKLIGDSPVQKVIKTPELALCEAQIELLQKRALEKELSLDETKRLDLLIKNKRLLSGEATTIEGQKKKPKFEYTEAELITAAKIDDNGKG